MEGRIVPLYGFQEIADNDLCFKLLHDLSLESFLRTLAGLYLSARELPPAFEVAIPTLGCEDLVSLDYYRCNYFDRFHILQKKKILS